MKTFLAAFLLTFISSLLLSRLMIWMAWRLRILDVGWGRKIHKGPVPRLGGLAVAIAFFIPVLSLWFWENPIRALVWEQEGPRRVTALLGGGVMALGLGLWDDVKGLRARYKLLGQLAIATFAWAMGVRIGQVDIPFIGQVDMTPLSVPITLFWIVGLMNAINLIDGVDGLCAGVVSIASIAILAISLAGNLHLIAFLCAGLLGATLGFLPYNFNPATIFLGDSGTYFLGYVMAVMSLLGTQRGNTGIALLAPILAFGVPIMDTALAIWRRAFTGRPIFAPDKGHIHHRLLASGQTQRSAVAFLYAVSMGLALAGVVAALGEGLGVGLALAVVLVLVVYLVGSLKLWRLPSPQSARDDMPPLPWELLRRSLPGFFEGMRTVSCREDLIRALQELCKTARFQRLQVSLKQGGDNVERWEVKGEEGGNPLRTYPQNEDFELKSPTDGKSLGLMRVEWWSELGGVEPEMRALMTLVADMVATTILRLSGSRGPLGLAQTGPQDKGSEEHARSDSGA